MDRLTDGRTDMTNLKVTFLQFCECAYKLYFYTWFIVFGLFIWHFERCRGITCYVCNWKKKKKIKGIYGCGNFALKLKLILH